MPAAGYGASSRSSSRGGVTVTAPAWVDTFVSAFLAIWLLWGWFGPQRIADMPWRVFLPLYVLVAVLILVLIWHLRVQS